MKSDLIGGTKTAIEDLECGQLYLCKRNGIVFLTNAQQPRLGVVVHSVNESRYPLGQEVLIAQYPHYEHLRGKVILSN